MGGFRSSMPARYLEPRHRREPTSSHRGGIIGDEAGHACLVAREALQNLMVLSLCARHCACERAAGPGRGRGMGEPDQSQPFRGAHGELPR